MANIIYINKKRRGVALKDKSTRGTQNTIKRET
jgi:hypothetical protein